MGPDGTRTDGTSPERRTPRRGHPWWQHRLATARRTTAFAAIAVGLAVALVATGVPAVVEGSSLLVLGGAAFWAPYSVASVAGAVAQRREERAAGG